MRPTEVAQLNQTRLLSVRADGKTFDFTGEGAPSYATSVGLTQFRRTLHYTAGKLTITDDITSATPHTYTEVLHSDAIIETTGSTFTFPINNIPLHVTLTAPTSAIAHVEPNVVMGPGRPGSVDKGTPEARGSRLTETTPQPVDSAIFNWQLSF